jgi:NADPH:quinone reductase-like Zn-dependent oxidoreductase
MDFSGVVEATGYDVKRFRAGDRVFGSASAMRRGAHAEYVAVRESDAIIHKPASLTDDEAAAIPFGANTALAFMRDIGRVQPGQRVLIIGASGGVGVWAVQLARHLGAEVTGVCSARNVELVRELGADHVIDHTTGPLLRDGKTYDLIFDTVGVTSFATCQHALTERGVFLPLNGDAREIFDAIKTTWSRGKRTKFAVSDDTRESLEHIAGLIAAGTLKPVIDRVYPMEDIVSAHRHVDSRHKRGSVIVSMSAEAATQ